MVGAWVPTGGDQARLQGQLRAAVLQLQSAAAGMQSLANIMSQMVGGGNDYTTIETYFGIGTGNGQTLSAVLGSANTQLQGSFVQALLQRFG